MHSYNRTSWIERAVKTFLNQSQLGVWSRMGLTQHSDHSLNNHSYRRNRPGWGHFNFLLPGSKNRTETWPLSIVLLMFSFDKITPTAAIRSSSASRWCWPSLVLRMARRRATHSLSHEPAAQVDSCPAAGEEQVFRNCCSARQVNSLHYSTMYAVCESSQQ